MSSSASLTGIFLARSARQTPTCLKVVGSVYGRNRMESLMKVTWDPVGVWKSGFLVEVRFVANHDAQRAVSLSRGQFPISRGSLPLYNWNPRTFDREHDRAVGTSDKSIPKLSGGSTLEFQFSWISTVRQ